MICPYVLQTQLQPLLFQKTYRLILPSLRLTTCTDPLYLEIFLKHCQRCLQKRFLSYFLEIWVFLSLHLHFLNCCFHTFRFKNLKFQILNWISFQKDRWLLAALIRICSFKEWLLSWAWICLLAQNYWRSLLRQNLCQVSLHLLI